MKISELKAREDFPSVLCATLDVALANRYGHPFRVEPRGGEQGWFLQALAGVCHTKDAGADVRSYIRRELRHSPAVWQRPARRFFSATVTTRIGLRAMGRTCFTVSPSVPDASHLLILPGNRRVRICDFASGRVRVVAKSGFGTQSIANELRIRLRPDRPPTVPILDHAADCAWLDEPLVEGYALPRCPPSFDRRQLELIAVEALRGWLERTATPKRAGEYVGQLVDRVESRLDSQRRPWSSFFGPAARHAVRVLHSFATQSHEVRLGYSHGDFQPGNILVGLHGRPVYLIDWEHAAERSFHYDYLVYSLRTRQTSPTSAQIRRFLDSRTAARPFGIAAPSRRQVLALFLLEDLLWALEEASQAPVLAAPPALRRYLTRLPALVSTLASFS